MTTTNESEEVLATYNLCLMGPRSLGDVGSIRRTSPWTQEVELQRSLLREVEENITDLLPAGYRVVIREWNHTEETP